HLRIVAVRIEHRGQGQPHLVRSCVAACRIVEDDPADGAILPCDELVGQGLQRCGGIVHHRTTSTGTFEWVSTLAVSLPSSTLERPRRPWDAITMRSHFCLRAAAMICSYGRPPGATMVAQRTPAALALFAALSTMRCPRARASSRKRSLSSALDGSRVSSASARNSGTTCIAVTRALTRFANAMPRWTPLSERGEPSVGKRICLKIILPPPKWISRAA